MMITEICFTTWDVGNMLYEFHKICPPHVLEKELLRRITLSYMFKFYDNQEKIVLYDFPLKLVSLESNATTLIINEVKRRGWPNKS